MSGISCTAPFMDTARVALLVFAALLSACGELKLNLGQDESTSTPTLPPRTADGGLDETRPWAIAQHQESAHVLAIDPTRLYWAGWTSDPDPIGLLRSCL